MDTEMPAPIEDDESKMGSFRDGTSDPGFLVAKGRFRGATESDKKSAEKEHVKKLAYAVFMALRRHGYAKVRAVGPFANYNAVKALIIATGYCAPKGIDLCFVPSFNEGNLGKLRDENHVETVTAILYSVKGFKEWSGTK